MILPEKVKDTNRRRAGSLTHTATCLGGMFQKARVYYTLYSLPKGRRPVIK